MRGDESSWEQALRHLAEGRRDVAARLVAEGSEAGQLEPGAAGRDPESADQADAWVTALVGLTLASGPPQGRVPTAPAETSAVASDQPAIRVGRSLQEGLRARIALSEGRLDDLAQHVAAADTYASEQWPWLRARVASLYQAAFRFTGRVEFRDAGVEICTRLADQIHVPHSAVLARSILGTIHLVSGRFNATIDSCESAIEFADATGLGEHPVVALAHQFKGYVLFEWNRSREARAELELAWNLAAPEGVGVRSGVSRMLAAVTSALDEPETSDMWFSRLEKIVSNPMTLRNREWLAAVRIRQGIERKRDLRAIDSWRQRYDYHNHALTGLPADEVPPRLHEFEHLLSVLEATQQWDAMLETAELMLAGNDQARLWFVVRALSAKAVALQALGQLENADQAWQEALVLGEPEGYVRVYSEGAPCRLELLRQASAGGPATAFAQRVLLVAGGTSHTQDRSVELTPRQHETLAHVARGFSNTETAEAMGLSVTTVKTHLRAIFALFEVRSRTQAVAEARRIGLL